MRKPLLILVVVANIVLHAASAITLKVTPRFQFAPGFIRLTLTIEPDTRNRAYCVSYEGTYSGQTCRELDGERAERTRWIELRDLPAGEYAGQVVLQRNDGSVISSGPVRWEVLESVPQDR